MLSQTPYNDQGRPWVLMSLEGVLIVLDSRKVFNQGIFHGVDAMMKYNS